MQALSACWYTNYFSFSGFLIRFAIPFGNIRFDIWLVFCLRCLSYLAGDCPFRFSQQPSCYWDSNTVVSFYETITNQLCFSVVLPLKKHFLFFFKMEWLNEYLRDFYLVATLFYSVSWTDREEGGQSTQTAHNNMKQWSVSLELKSRADIKVTHTLTLTDERGG